MQFSICFIQDFLQKELICTTKFKYFRTIQNLFTQGMVCHESYQDDKGNWLYPDEVKRIDTKTVIKKKDKTTVKVGPAESMSKSKKNTIDPEKMIENYGADSVRWFILSDSPPEKDVQWSDTGVASANKFLQKIWNLNYLVANRKDKSSDIKSEEKFILTIKSFINKIDSSIKNFRFNVSIANFYEIYNFIKDNLEKDISNKIFKGNLIEIMKLMIPFTPHLAFECLLHLDCKETNKWPSIDKEILENIKINLVVQVNGKTRDVLNIKKDTDQKEIEKLIMKTSKANKHISNKKIIKTIFIKNKIINYIINDK